MSVSDELILLIISSPSGAGKTTLTHRLLQDFPGLRFSVSHTTRKPRTNEVDGQDYYFIDEEDFRKRVANDEFAEWAEVHGNLYGTHTDELNRAKEAKKIGLLFDVDYQGARQIKSKYPHAVGVFILPPSMKELRRRLEGRASDEPAVIERRYAKASEEIAQYPFFDYLVINDDLQAALSELRGIVHAERCRQARRANIAEALLDTTN